MSWLNQAFDMAVIERSEAVQRIDQAGISGLP
jgi:hypothetical protein